MTYCIYYLINTNTNQVYYVGVTANFYTRYQAHKSKEKSKGIAIDMCLIERIATDNKQDAQNLECFWIQQFKCWGFDIKNKNKTGIEARYNKVPKDIKVKRVVVKRGTRETIKERKARLLARFKESYGELPKAYNHKKAA